MLEAQHKKREQEKAEKLKQDELYAQYKEKLKTEIPLFKQKQI